MSFLASGGGNRFGSLAVNITDPNDVPKTKIHKVKKEPKTSKPKEVTIVPNEVSKTPSSSTNEKKNIKQAQKSDVKVPQEPKKLGVMSEKKAEAKFNESSGKSCTPPSREHTKTTGRAPLVQHQENESRNKLKNPSRIEDNYSSRQRSFGNPGRRGIDSQDSKFNHNGDGPLIDLDEEIAGPARYGRGRNRFSDRDHPRNNEFDVSKRGERTFERHSGTVRGSYAYNKRENRGPDSALLKESNFLPNDVALNNSYEKFDDSLLQGLEPSGNAPVVQNTFTLDEFRKLKENEKFASLTLTEDVPPAKVEKPQVTGQNDNDYRSRSRGDFRGYSGNRRNDDEERGPREGAYRYNRRSRGTVPDTSERNQTNNQKLVKLDLEKDFPALN